nr:hypothetical protein [uncultured Emticicia sp.]
MKPILSSIENQSQNQILNLRECIVNKNVIMYYAVDEVEREVVVLALRNTKQIL